MLTHFAINSRVIVHIHSHIPPGLLGRVQDGTRAIVRNREIAWNDPDPREDYVDQTYEAVVIGHNRTLVRPGAN